MVSSYRDFECILLWSEIVTKDDHYCLDLSENEYENICI